MFTRIARGLCALTALAAATTALAQTPIGTTFTYQGELHSAGQPLTGAADVRFRLYDAGAVGNQIGVQLDRPAVSISAGRITQDLDFGAGAFSGGARWLEIDVRSPAGSGSYVTLSPRIRLQPTPVAQYALDSANSGQLGGHASSFFTTASNLTGTLPSAVLSGTYSSAVSLSNAANAFTGNGAGLTALNATNLATGTIANARTTGTSTSTANTLVLRDASGNFSAGTITASLAGTASQLNGQPASFYTDASNLSTGTLNAARLPAAVARTNLGNAFGAFPNTFAGNLGVATNTPAGLLDVSSTCNPSAAVIDQQQPNSDTGFGSADEWQSFTAGATGYLTRVDLKSVSPLADSTSPGRIWIYAGEGTGGQLLASQAITYPVQFGNISFTAFPIQAAPFITAGQQYTIRFTCPVYVLDWLVSQSGNPYAGGRASHNASHDYPFRAWVAPAAGSPGLVVLSSGSVGVRTATPIQELDINGRVNVGAGVIQRGGAAITTTSDLGLYSRSAGLWLRFVTNGGEFKWYGADGVDGAGTNQAMGLTAAGNLAVTGSVSKAGGSFKIDHPLDPKNKYLYHSFVESPDMMNIYNGVATTDDRGYATITLPEYFEALNRDYRYQLTVIDESDDTDVFLWAKVVRKVQGNQFTIRSSRPNMEVSWQVTGIRHDAWAEANRIPTSVEKTGDEKGVLLHPGAFKGRVGAR